MFKPNDIVRIIRNSAANQPNSYINMKGMIGYIEEIIGEYAQFNQLTLDDSCGGCGSVLLENLVLEPDPAYHQALQKKKDREEKLNQQYEAYALQRKIHFEKWAEKLNCSVKDLKAAYNDLYER